MRGWRRRALARAELERVGARQLAQPAFLDQALVDGSHSALEGRVDGRAERDRLAVHRAARRDHEVGEGDQRLGVDRRLRHDEARGRRRSCSRCAATRGKHDDLQCPRARPRAGARAPGRRGHSRNGGRATPPAVCARRTSGRVRSRPSSCEHGRVGLEVGEVVLLLEARVAAQLACGSVSVEPLGRYRLGYHNGPREAAVDAVLHGRPLVVEHRRAGYPQDRGGNGHVVGAVTERQVEAPAAGCAGLGAGPAHERSRARGEAERLGPETLAPVAPDRRLRDAEALAQLDGLCEVARRHTHLVTVRAQPLEDGAHDQHVGTVGQVDPDAHWPGR